MKSFMASPATIERKWYVVDATGYTLGRLSSEIAKVLRGKNKPIFTPHMDCGDYVIVVNADKVKLIALTDVEQVQEHSDISVFAEDGIIKINGDYDSMQIYTTEGKEIANSQLNSRVYLVRIVAGNHIYIKKIAL